MRALASAFLAVAVFVLSAQPPTLSGQVRSTYDLGAAGLVQRLLRLQTTASALHIGAHPDDESSGFMTRTARGDHARTAYLSLNRGEGGQNIIGPELFDALGVIRTEELLQARRLYGADHFFTRAFDYGFSKTRAEAAARWDEQLVLGDMVRVIRTFRPLVIYSRWQGTPADGHGHHQLAGSLAPQAFDAAADANAFPEQIAEGLTPWRALKLYLGTGNQPTAETRPTLRLQTGILDPVLGRTYAAIAAEGRSLHRSQAQGGIEPFGPAAVGLRLVRSFTPQQTNEQSVFDGIDVTIPALGAVVGLAPDVLRNELAAIARAAREALDQYQPRNPGTIAARLAEGVMAARAARAALGRAAVPAQQEKDVEFLLRLKEADFTEALVQAAGVQIDPLADQEVVAEGASLEVAVRTFVSGQLPVRIESATLNVPQGWSMTPVDEPGRGGIEQPTHLARFRVRVPESAPPTQPYWLASGRKGDIYQWPETAPKGLPFAPPLITATIAMEIAGVTLEVSRPAEYRLVDDIRGELRREINVVPPVTVGLDSSLLLVNRGTAPSERRVVVRVTGYRPGTMRGVVRLRVPDGWSVTPREAPFDLASSTARTATVFSVRVPAARSSGTFTITAEAQFNGRTLSQDMQTVAYPHIQTHRLYWPATATVQVMDLKVAPVRVGYVMGSGDRVPEALRRMGVDVSLIDETTLATGDLSRFDTIVVGIRASEARPGFAAEHARLLQYVERGGTLIVQYQQTDYVARNLAPLPAEARTNSRVTDETAPVRILAPGHPVFTFPNQITAADFNGWVQERNLYAFPSFDSRYTPLLASADPGEPEQLGGELYAELGRGRYVYTAYSWFRQLPAGVPGAYRQFANLISLSKAPRTAGSRASGAAARTGAAAPPESARTRQSR